MKSIHEALAARIPEFAADIEEQVTARVESAFKRFGIELKEPSVWDREGYAVCRFAQSMSNVTKKAVPSGRALEWAISVEKVRDFAEKRAAEIALAWEQKITGKLESLTNVELLRDDGYSYRINGKRAGRDVRIEQQMTLCCNAHGTVYNQFPARIYLNGKFTPEAQYKKEFGAELPVRDEKIVGYKVRRTASYGVEVYPVAADGKIVKTGKRGYARSISEGWGVASKMLAELNKG